MGTVDARFAGVAHPCCSGGFGFSFVGLVARSRSASAVRIRPDGGVTSRRTWVRRTRRASALRRRCAWVLRTRRTSVCAGVAVALSVLDFGPKPGSAGRLRRSRKASALRSRPTGPGGFGPLVFGLSCDVQVRSRLTRLTASAASASGSATAWHFRVSPSDWLRSARRFVGAWIESYRVAARTSPPRRRYRATAFGTPVSKVGGETAASLVASAAGGAVASSAERCVDQALGPGTAASIRACVPLGAQARSCRFSSVHVFGCDRRSWPCAHVGSEITSVRLRPFGTRLPGTTSRSVPRVPMEGDSRSRHVERSRASGSPFGVVRVTRLNASEAFEPDDPSGSQDSFLLHDAARPTRVGTATNCGEPRLPFGEAVARCRRSSRPFGDVAARRGWCSSRPGPASAGPSSSHAQGFGLAAGTFRGFSAIAPAFRCTELVSSSDFRFAGSRRSS